MNKRAAITIIDIGYDYKREIDILADMGVSAAFLPLEGTSDTAKIMRAMDGYDIVLAGPELWDAAAMDGVKSLEMIARLGTGIEKIDLEAATQRGIAVTNTAGANACSVAQHVVAFMLDLALSVTRYDRNMRRGIMTRRRAEDIIGKTVGLVGFGNIPQIVAQLLSGFDIELLVYDIRRDEEAAQRLNATYVEMDELIARSDFISLHVPLNKHTQGMADKAFFQKMKDTAYLINTSRGGVVNEDDLIDALRGGVIAGAALDVYAASPPDAGSPLMHMDNVVHTPYVAFSSALGNRRTMDMAIDSIRAYLSGREIPHLLNPEYQAHKR
jgi:phosphoglycerate dehydrogenase-like enzyme